MPSRLVGNKLPTVLSLYVVDEHRGSVLRFLKASSMSTLSRTKAPAKIAKLTKRERSRRRKTGQQQKNELAKGGRDPLEQLMEHLRAGDVSEKAALAMSPGAIHAIPTHAAIIIANGGIASLVALGYKCAARGSDARRPLLGKIDTGIQYDMVRWQALELRESKLVLKKTPDFYHDITPSLIGSLNLWRPGGMHYQQGGTMFRNQLSIATIGQSAHVIDQFRSQLQGKCHRLITPGIDREHRRPHLRVRGPSRADRAVDVAARASTQSASTCRLG